MRFILVLLLLPFSLGAQKPEVVVSTGHNDMISTIAMSDDGIWMASGGNDKIVKVIHVPSGKEMRTIAGFDNRVNHLDFDKTGQYLGINLNNGALKVVDIHTGNEVMEFQTASTSYEFGYCSNNEKIAFLDHEGKVNTIDFKTGENRKVLGEEYGYLRIATSEEHNHAYLHHLEGKMVKVDLATGEIMANNQVHDEYVYMTSRIAVDEKEEYVAAAFDDNDIYIFNAEDMSLIGKLTDHETRIWDLKFDGKSQTLISADHDGYIKTWNVKRMKNTLSIKPFTFSTTCLEVHPEEKVILVPESKMIHYLRQRDGKVIKDFETRGNKIMNMAYDQKGKYLATSTLDLTVKLWDLEQNKISHVFSGFWPVAIHPDGDHIVTMGNTLSLWVWDIRTGEKLYDLTTENELLQNLSFSKDGKYMAGAGFYGVIKVYDLEEKKIIKRLTGHAGGVYGTAFSPDAKLLASAGMDGTMRVWDLETGQQKHSFKKSIIIMSDVEFSPDGSKVAASCWDKKVYVWDTETWAVDSLEGHTNMITTVDWSPDGKYIASGAGNNSVAEADNSVIVWDVENMQKHCQYTGHIDIVNKVIFDATGDYIFSAGNDGMVKVWDYKDCGEIGSMVSVRKTDYLIVTPDNYYMASKDALEAVSFRVGYEMYPFEQFDLKLNRPDIVASRLGKTPQGLINAYEYIYKKRLRKMGFKEEDLGDDFHLPKLDIESKDVPLVTKESSIKVDVLAHDDLYTIDRINVYVNDVPLFGQNGISVKDKNVKSIKYEVDVDLIPGKNKIQFSTMNEKGVESLRKTISIMRDEEAVIGDLYLITIGVSDYKDDRFDLKYPAKDARDVAATLRESEGLYKEVHVKELTDQDVTKENIEALEEWLSKAKPSDAVIIFIAGHGVLDGNFNYYYGTHDMDFDNPTERGLPYETLDEILNSVRAIKKLLIMDTCHSGEVDKEEVEKVEAEVEVEENVEFRAAGQGVRQKEAFGLYNSYELSQSLFSDIRRGSGATVISSAGGAEYAMESDEWQNGLFTYNLLRGIQRKKADQDHDGAIVISELRHYVYEQVSEMSGGKQKPTAREENISLDYRVW